MITFKRFISETDALEDLKVAMFFRKEFGLTKEEAQEAIRLRRKNADFDELWNSGAMVKMLYAADLIGKGISSDTIFDTLDDVIIDRAQQYELDLGSL